MQYVNRWIADSEYTFLEITINDAQDIEDLTKHTNTKNVVVGLDDIKCLKGFSQIEKLIITSGQPSNSMYEVFSKMTALKALKIDYEEVKPSTDWCIDVSVFPNLEYLFSRSSYNFCGIHLSRSLKTLKVMKWYEKDLNRLKGASIDSLCICGGRLQSLVGIENLSIQILSLSNLRNLKDISAAKTNPLKILELENCNQISSFESFSSETLEYLMVYGKNKVQSGGFVSKFKHLKRVMLDIIIEDGNLSFFDNLEHAVILTDKKAFNRTNSALPKSGKQYIIKTIPEWRYIFSDRSI